MGAKLVHIPRDKAYFALLWQVGFRVLVQITNVQLLLTEALTRLSPSLPTISNIVLKKAVMSSKKLYC
jgi:hypothetical protein